MTLAMTLEYAQEHVLLRQQSPKKGKSKFAGPDTYVALVRVPAGVPFNPTKTPLQVQRLRAKGIEVTYCGEGYGRHTGPRSALGRAIARAYEMMA